MNEIVQLDLTTVDDQLELHALNVERVQRDAIFEIGRELAGAQQIFRYRKDEGGFTGWLARRLPHIPQMSAYRAIEIAKGIDPEMFTQWVNMSPRALAEVAKTEPDVQAIIAARVEAGEIFTAAKVRELNAKAATDALTGAQAEADQLRQQLADLRDRLASKESDAGGLQDEVDRLTGELKAHEDRIARYQDSLPTPKQAEQIAAAEGGLIFGKDGKFHSGATPEQRVLTDQYLRIWSHLGELASKETPPALNVVAGCDPAFRDQLRKYCDGATAYIRQIKEALDA